MSGDEIEVSVPLRVSRRGPGIVVHRRRGLADRDLTQHHAIPVTTPICTLVDIATRLERGRLEAAINEADKRDLTDPEEMRSALDELPRRPGVGALRETLDRLTPVRFTRAQVRFEPGHVEGTLAVAARRLRPDRARRS